MFTFYCNVTDMLYFAKLFCSSCASKASTKKEENDDDFTILCPFQQYLRHTRILGV